MQFTFRLYDNFVEKLQIFKNLVKFRQFADILETFGANAYAVPLRNNAYHMSNCIHFKLQVFTISLPFLFSVCMNDSFVFVIDLLLLYELNLNW